MSDDEMPREINWDAAYAAGVTPWDKGAPAPPVVEYLQRAKVTGQVLVPGCGRGHDARAIAMAGATGVLGLDISERAIAAAPKADDPGGLRFEVGNFLELEERHRGSFDWVFEHTCLSGLHPSLRAAYAESVAAALKPGGKYLAIFFLTPWDEGEQPEPPPYAISTDEIATMFDGRLQTEEEWWPTRHFSGREGRELMRVMVN